MSGNIEQGKTLDPDPNRITGVTPVNYELLLTDDFAKNQFWQDLVNSMTDVLNPVIHNPIDALQQIRSITVEPYYAGLNLQMVGFKVPVLSFTPHQYQLLMANIGKFVQTRGASLSFIDFVGFILNIEFEPLPLWANDITDINSLNNIYGTPIWQGGDWFPTPFLDVGYDINFSVDESQIRFLFQVLAPIHLVIRKLIGIYRGSTGVVLTPYATETFHDYSLANNNTLPPLPNSILDSTFILDVSIMG